MVVGQLPRVLLLEGQKLGPKLNMGGNISKNVHHSAIKVTFRLKMSRYWCHGTVMYVGVPTSVLFGARPCWVRTVETRSAIKISRDFCASQ